IQRIERTFVSVRRPPVRKRLPTTPVFVDGAGPVAALQVFQPGGAVGEAAGTVACQPEGPVAVDQGGEVVGEAGAGGGRDGGEPAVGVEAGVEVAAEELDELDRSA